MDQIQKQLLAEVAGFHETPAGAYNIRANGESSGQNTTANIDIVPKENGSGIEIYVKPGTKKESLHIPVLLSQSGLEDTVYNDFFIGEGADIVIIAGCGIHNGGSKKTQHDGIHTFYIEKGAKVKYIEKHYGQGEGTGERVLNPKTVIHINEDGYMEIDSVQIKGVDSTIRETEANLKEGATLVVKEKIMTHDSQTAETSFSVVLNGKRASANIVSRSVARDMSRQLFLSRVYGNADCTGHTECDSIIMDDAYVGAIPEIHANHKEAYRDNTGLLLFGDVGTGKSFFAGCIANALLDRDVPVLMTNFPSILNRLTGMFAEDRAAFIASLDDYSLLVIDDLGVERSTEYAMEQMFTVIDSRYRSKKPLIVTTNLKLEEIKNPPDLAHARIYDRILERCAPVLFSGKNFREEGARATKAAAKEIVRKDNKV